MLCETVLIGTMLIYGETKMQDFQKLVVWQKSHQLTSDVYRITRTYPKEELYGLISQTRRAAASVPANIAEGCGRNGGADLARFLHIAAGSVSELDYHLILARDLDFIKKSDQPKLSRNIAEVRQMLFSLHKRVHPKTIRETDN
jgi:four helix bundle protein